MIDQIFLTEKKNVIHIAFLTKFRLGGAYLCLRGSKCVALCVKSSINFSNICILRTLRHFYQPKKIQYSTGKHYAGRKKAKILVFDFDFGKYKVHILFTPQFIFCFLLNSMSLLYCAQTIYKTSFRPWLQLTPIYDPATILSQCINLVCSFPP